MRRSAKARQTVSQARDDGTNNVARTAQRERWGLFGILLIIALGYLRCLSNEFVFDDHEMIIANKFISDWSFISKSLIHDSWWFRDPKHLPQSSYYRPLQDIWLALNFQAFGLHPVGWHLAMVALHLAVVLLVFRVARLVTNDATVAFVATLLFGILPVHAEAVVWPAAIPEPLAGAFELGAFVCFLRSRSGRRAGLASSLALFALALLSHESAVAFPLAIFAYVALLESNAKVHRRKPVRSGRYDELAVAVRRSAPFFLLVVGYMGVRFAVLGFITRPNPGNHATAGEIAATIPLVLSTYVKMLAVPWLAGPSHRIEIVTRFGWRQFYLPVAALLLLLAGGRAALGRGPKTRLRLFCVMWLGVTLAPMLNLGGLFEQALVQDRYLYLPSFGVCLLAADAGVSFARTGAIRARVAGLSLALAVVLCAVTLWSVQAEWRDDVVLFGRCVELFPECAIYHNRLGMALEQRGDLAGAERELDAAVKLEPEDPASEYDLGLVHQRLGREREAASEMAGALAKLPTAPPDAYVNLAAIYDALGLAKERDDALAEATRRAPPARISR